MSIIAIIDYYWDYFFNYFFNYFIHYCNYLFWYQLFAIIARDGHRLHASGCQHTFASRTGTRLSSLWRDHLCSQTKQDAQLQPLRPTNGQCTCHYWAYFFYYCDYCALLSSILAKLSRCRSQFNDYQEQCYHHQECQSRPLRLHKGWNRVNSCHACLIIVNYCHYWNYYCDYSYTKNGDLHRFLMWTPGQQAKDLTAITSNHRRPRPMHPVQLTLYAQQGRQHRSS